MKKIGLFWGSNTGNQEEAAGFLKDFLESEGVELDEFNIADTDLETISSPKPPKAQNFPPVRFLVSIGDPSNSCPS